MEKLQGMLRKLSIDSESRLNRPVYRAKLFEIEELSCFNKQRKKDRLTLIEAWFGNIPITIWDKNTLESNDIIFNPYGIWINDDIGRGYYDTSPEHSTFIAYTNIYKIKDYTKGINK